MSEPDQGRKIFQAPNKTNPRLLPPFYINTLVGILNEHGGVEYSINHSTLKQYSFNGFGVVRLGNKEAIWVNGLQMEYSTKYNLGINHAPFGLWLVDKEGLPFKKLEVSIARDIRKVNLEKSGSVRSVGGYVLPERNSLKERISIYSKIYWI